MSYTDDTLLHYFFCDEVTKSDISFLFHSIATLTPASECDDVIPVLINKIETLFDNVDEKDCAKKIDNIIYYPNGLIKNTITGEVIIASPWTPSTTLKDKKSKTKKRKHQFLYLGYSILSYQMKTYIGSIRSRTSLKINGRNFNTDLSSFLSKVELNNSISDKDKALLNIKKNNPYELASYIGFLQFFFNEFKRNMYFTDKNCEEMLSIYDTLDSDGTNDHKCVYYKEDNSLISQIEDYISCNCNNFVDFDFECLKYGKDGKRYCLYYTWAEGKGYLNDYLETEEGYNYYLEQVINAYNAIYAVQDENFRKTMIKLKVIREGYIPNIVLKQKEDDIKE